MGLTNALKRYELLHKNKANDIIEGFKRDFITFVNHFRTIFDNTTSELEIIDYIPKYNWFKFNVESLPNYANYKKCYGTAKNYFNWSMYGKNINYDDHFTHNTINFKNSKNKFLFDITIENEKEISITFNPDFDITNENLINYNFLIGIITHLIHNVNENYQKHIVVSTNCIDITNCLNWKDQIIIKYIENKDKYIDENSNETIM